MNNMHRFTVDQVNYSRLSDRGIQVWHALQLERLSGVRPWSAFLAVGMIALIIHAQSFA